MNIAGCLEENAGERPDDVALTFQNRRLTFRQIDQEVNRLANVLQGLGVGKGDRVSVMLPNCPEFITAFYAITKLGAVEASINTMFKEEETAHILCNSGARV